MSDQLWERLQAALAGSYTLDRELGGGGMSRVFVADDVRLGRKVVLKVLLPDLAAGVSMQRFEREIQFAARLQHPNIVPVLAAGEAAELPYFTMPFVEGESLRARFSKSGEMPVADVVAMMRDVARALAYAHEHRLAHRDIKPENILFADGTAMVTDFGIAKALAASMLDKSETLTNAGVSLGTPMYMAPEQAMADPIVDGRADLYALGVVAYEALAGQPPFTTRGAAALMAAHATQTPIPLTQHRPRIPAALGSLVMRLLEKRPADRPQTAQDVLAELGPMSTPVGTTAVGLSPAWPTRARSRTAVTAAIAVVALAALVVLQGKRAGGSGAIDANVIAVAPFRVSATDSSLSYLGEGMVDLVSARLSGATGIRAANTRTVLGAWRRAAGTDRDIPEESAVRVASKAGAGRLLLGEIVGSAGRISINGSVLSVPQARRLSTTSVQGPADSLTALVDRFVGQLLTLESGEGEERLGVLTTTSLPALRSFLDGQALFRSGRYREALFAYRRAVEIDSTFALAGIGLIQVAGWSGATATERRDGTILGRTVAWNHRHRLPPRDLALLHARVGGRYPAIHTYAERLRAAEAFVSMAGDSPEAWYEVGDALFHAGQLLDIADADDRAFRAFMKAIELDSTYAPAIEHLPILYQRLGDTAAVRRTTALLINPDAAASGRLEGHAWYLAHATGDSATVRTLRARIGNLPVASLGIMSQAATDEGIGSGDLQRIQKARLAAAVTNDDRQGAEWQAYLAALEAGRPLEAARFFSQPLRRSAHLALHAVLWDGDTTLSASAAAHMRPMLREHSPAEAAATLSHLENLFALAQYDLAQGNSATAKTVVARLRGFQPPRDSLWMSEEPRRLALMLDAQLADIEKRSDALPLLRQLDSTLSQGIRPASALFPTVGTIVAARLWERQGDLQRALKAIRRREVGQTTLPYRSLQLHEEGRLAEAVGDVNGAIRAYRHYLALRVSPEPSLVAEAAEAKRKLAKLESMSRGR